MLPRLPVPFLWLYAATETEREMGVSGVVLAAALLGSLPAKASGYLPASFGFQRPSRHHAPTRVPTTAGVPPRPSTSLRINKEDLPDETVRQLAAANQRVKEVEEEYWKSLDADEIAIERKCASGLACLKVPGMLDKAAEYYTAAADLRCEYDDGGHPNNLRKGEGFPTERQRGEDCLRLVHSCFLSTTSAAVAHTYTPSFTRMFPCLGGREGCVHSSTTVFESYAHALAS